MDDIWNLRDNETGKYCNVQDKLEKVGIPLEADCCRILVSTRDDSVARVLRAEIYSLPLLSFESGKEMFLKDISLHFDGKDSLVDKIVKTCGGVPLAIKVMSGMLRDKDPREWPQISKELLKSPENKVLSSVRLSYSALSSSLKSCFAYLAIFPEDHEIDATKVVHLWKAEGFVKDEAESKDALNKLLQKHLLEIHNSERFVKEEVKSRIASNKIVQNHLREIHEDGFTEDKAESLDASKGFIRMLLREIREVGDSIPENCITMHDLVRDVALEAFKGNGGLSGIDDTHSLKNELLKQNKNTIRRVSASLSGESKDGRKGGTFL
eukprot:TRINITY_DN19564_c0_g2_i1.p1 TRINITY_DN19564_c0_g2~~TRINITY_DN19564_c0_g2_i1.p1  ORF type:complete len:370 (+),score=67.35 TRINITY_DN19564_c0_g2_i1:140-1111(+)